MKTDPLINLLESWAAERSLFIITEVRPEPPPVMFLPGHASSVASGLLITVHPVSGRPDVWLGLWLPDQGEGLWSAATSLEAEIELHRLAPCAAPAEVVAQLDRLTRDFLALLEKDHA